MTTMTEAMELALRRDIDSSASVQPMAAKLSAYLAGSYDLYTARLLGKELALAEPTEADESPNKLEKRTTVLEKALNKPITLYFATLTRPRRRALMEAGRAFVTGDGDYFLPQLALLLSKKASPAFERERTFSPAQQAVFLYCLYAKDEPVTLTDVQSALGLSAGSVSAALTLFAELGLLGFTTGGKTGRKKSYALRDKARFYRDGIRRFGSPVREVVKIPLDAAPEGWLRSGLSALADQSDLLPPARPEFAVSPLQAKQAAPGTADTVETCSVKVLRYDPTPFAAHGRVDPLTMMLTIDDNDERISLALKQALRSCEWYQD